MSDADDRLIWQFAIANGFVIVTQDSDFAEMAALFGPPPQVIWLKCGNQRTEYVEALIRLHLTSILEFDEGTDPCLEVY